MHVCHVTQVFAATLTPAGLAGLRFADGEVVGLYLCSLAEAIRLMTDEPHRVAPGLVQSLPRYVEEVSGAMCQVSGIEHEHAPDTRAPDTSTCHLTPATLHLPP